MRSRISKFNFVESTFACDQTIDEEGDISDQATDYDTVYLTNASEVALSLLQLQKAENYLDRATRVQIQIVLPTHGFINYSSR